MRATVSASTHRDCVREALSVDEQVRSREPPERSERRPEADEDEKEQRDQDCADESTLEAHDYDEEQTHDVPATR